MKKADASGAQIALIVGSQEVATDTVTVKHLRQASDQVRVAVADLAAFIEGYVRQS